MPLPSGKIPPFRLAALSGQPGAHRFRLPLLLRLLARRGPRPLVLLAEAAAGVGLAAEDAAGRPLGHWPRIEAQPFAVPLPRGAATLVLHRAAEEEGAPPPRLGWYPLARLALRWQALRHGVPAPQAAVRALRAQLKRAIWTSPAADLFNLPAYRRYHARHVGDFRDSVAPDAAPPVAFASAAAELPLARLAAVARTLAAQTDRHFSWILAVPPARLAREGAALAALGARLVEAPADAAAGLAAAIDASGEALLVPLDLAGAPTRDAVAMIRAAFAQAPDCALAYTDEGFRDAAGRPAGAAFKPAFNRHLQIAAGYMGHLVALPAADARALRLNPALGGAALHDLLLRHIEAVPPARILHIPRIAYEGPERPGDGFLPLEAARARDALAARLGLAVETAPIEPGSPRLQLRPLYRVPAPPPLVSIVVPTRDRAELLATTLKTLIALTAYRAFEIVIVDNGSREPATFALFEEIEALWPATRVVRDAGDFNFARLCNAGVAAAGGAMILLLNNDMEIIESGWLGEMVSLAALSGEGQKVGIVGAKLLYPSRRVQHAGFIVGLREGAGGHWFVGAGRHAGGLRGRLALRQNLSAVTGACLLVTRACLDAVGGLDELRFAEDCNDIDLCLRARHAGFEVVFTPLATLIHHESASRLDNPGSPISATRREEWARFEALWAPSRHIDPHYSPNLRRDNIYALPARHPAGPRAPRTESIGTGAARPAPRDKPGPRR
ncbi:GT2 family glycosyltransferase [Ancylobacter sp. 3268]|uniref:glycosyltransferase family 2 protein n=1 Tax=Ancylobacter sp. 3268 TaxID=2817752 RepID=UPI00285C344A|nr:glycosyltransferase family 2 protein [Ancylobacter sp. 3268]MDR6954457.1 GT2 family glycosyltransferase [Ancylobacter sp. 3268]